MIGLLVLLSIGAVALVAGAVLGLMYLHDAHRKEASRSAVFLNRLHKEAIKSRDIEPFAGWMADEIGNYLTKG